MDVPLLFPQRQLMQVDIDGGFVEGEHGITYTMCEVYAPQSLATQVWSTDKEMIPCLSFIILNADC